MENTCPECGASFARKHHRQVFCTPAHKTRFYNVQCKRGVVMGPLLAVWARGRRKPTEQTRYAFAQMCALESEWAREDKAAGRNPALVVAIKQELGWIAADL